MTDFPLTAHSLKVAVKMGTQQKTLEIRFENCGTFIEQTLSSPKANEQTPPSPKNEASPSSDFQFVNISAPSEIKDTETRKFIRSSVANNCRRKQFLRHSHSSSQGVDTHYCLDTKPTSFLAKNFCQVCGFSFRKKTASRASKQCSQESPEPEKGVIETEIFAAGRVDPFSSFPIPTKPYMYTLIDHCQFFFLSMAYEATIFLFNIMRDMSFPQDSDV